MADYSAKIKLIVDGLQSLKQVEERLTNLNRLAALDLGKAVKGTRTFGAVKKEVDDLAGSFSNLGKIVRGIAVGTGLGALTTSINGLSQAATALKFGGISKFAAALAAATGPAAGLFKELSALAIQFPIVAGTATVAGAALLAFSPQILRAGNATLRLAKAAAEAGQPLSRLMASLASSGFRVDMFIDATQAVKIYQSRLRELSETVSVLSARQTALQTTLNKFNSESDTAAKIAGKLVDVTKRLNTEQQAQNDLLREAAGLRPESVERRATNTYNVTQRRKGFEADQAADIEVVNQALDKLNRRNINWADALGISAMDAAAQKAEQLTARFIKNDKVVDSWITALYEGKQALAEINRTMEVERLDSYTRAVLAQQRALDLYTDTATQAKRAAEALNYAGETPALRPAGFTNEDVRIKNLIDDENTVANLIANNRKTQAALQSGLDAKFFAQQIEQTQKELDAELDKIETIVQAQLKADRRVQKDFDARLAARGDEIKGAKELERALLSLEMRRVQETNAMLDEKAAQVALNLERKKEPGFFNSPGMRSEKQKGPGFRARLSKPSSKLGSAVIGGGFPALTGGGPGTIAGGALGGIFGGFAGSIGGSAIGQFIDQAVAGVQKLGNAFVLAAGSYSAIREQGVVFTAELEKQVRLVKQQGDFAKARELASGSLAGQTGDIGGVGVQVVTASVNELQKAWNGVTKAVSLTLGIIASPFIAALALVLRAVQSIFMLVNAVSTGIAAVINLIPGAKQLGDAIAEQAQKGTAEYENQLAELDKQIATGHKLLQIETAKNRIVASSFGKSKEELAIAQKEADAKERILKFEQAQDALEADAPIGTAELRKKLAVQLAIQSRTFRKQEQTLALTNATELANKIKDYNREVAETKRQYEQQYQDAVREASRAQADDDLAAIRRLQDARIKMREQELAYIQKIQQEEIKAAQIASQQRALTGSVGAAISGNPNAELLNTVQTAVENYRTGRLSVEQEAAAKQQQSQLQYQKTELAILRAKIDNARRIARLNEDSQIKIARINEAINKQNEAASRRKFDVEKASQLAGLNTLKLRETLEGFRAEKMMTAEKAKGNKADPAFVDYYKLLSDTAAANIASIDGSIQQVKQLFAQLPVNKLPGMAALPARTDTTGDASAAELAAANQLAAFESQVTVLQRINGLKKEDLELAKAILTPGSQTLSQLNSILEEQRKTTENKKIYADLISKGIVPALATELAAIQAAGNAVTSTINAVIALLQTAASDPEVQKIINQLIKIREAGETKTELATQGAIQAATPPSSMQLIAAEAGKAKEALETLVEPANMIASAAAGIGDAFGASFKGIVDGSMTAKEGLATFFKSVADMFLDMAAQIIAAWMKMIILNTIVKIFGGGLTNAASPEVGAIGQGSSIYAAAEGAYWPGGFQAFADGGLVTKPTMGLIGEGGESEYVIPASKMQSAMSRYSRGARGESVLAGGGASSESGAPAAGGPMAIDVRYSVERINDVEYVTASQFQAGMLQAAQQGAAQGEQRTLRRLQQSPSTRKRVGV